MMIISDTRQVFLCAAAWDDFSHWWQATSATLFLNSDAPRAIRLIREIRGFRIWGLPAVVPSHTFYKQTRANSRWPKLLFQGRQLVAGFARIQIDQPSPRILLNSCESSYSPAGCDALGNCLTTNSRRGESGFRDLQQQPVTATCLPSIFDNLGIKPSAVGHQLSERVHGLFRT